MSSDPAKVLAECADVLNKHLSHKRSPSFLGALGKREKGFKMLGFSTQSIPLHCDKFGDRDRLSVDVVVIDAVKEGFCKVPIENQGNKNKPADNAKPLSELLPWPRNKALSCIRCWPYKSVPNCPKDKDERCETMASEVYPGMVLRLSLWADKARGSKKPSDMGKGLLTTCDEDEIPAYTVFVFEVDCKGWAETITVKGKAIESPTTKGYAISISRIDPVPEVSLYSLIDKLPLALRETVAESREDNQQWHDQFPSIKNVIASQGSVFFVREVSAQATVDVDDRAELADANYPPQIRLHNWSVAGDAPECRHPIDILVDHAMAATNTCTIEAACAMLEIAANAKALRVVACSSDYRAGKESVRSPLAGWPIVDTEVLLSAIKTPVSPKDLVIDATGNYAVFKPDFEVAFPRMPENEEEDEAQNGDDEVERLSPLLYVSTTVLSPVNGSSRVKTPDFMLCGPDIDLGKALFVRFVHPRFPQQCILMSAYVNLGRPQIVMPGLGINILTGACGAAASALSAGQKRQRWMQQAGNVDPFAGKAPAVPPATTAAAAAATDSGDNSGDEAAANAAPAASAASSNSKKEKKHKSSK